MDETRHVTQALRGVGIRSINIDLMYGLPYQTVARVLTTVETSLELAPGRVCLFGYAHVPWMKKHQRLIDEAVVPDARERFAQYQAAAGRLREAGYVWIGLDHFARPGDALAKTVRVKTLHRNFQGYTTDDAPVRLGFGPSAIGMLPQGFVQNEAPIRAYRNAVDAGALEEMVTDGLVEIDGWRIRMTEAGRPFLRTACAIFDSYLEAATGRHAQAV